MFTGDKRRARHRREGRRPTKPDILTPREADVHRHADAPFGDPGLVLFGSP